MANEERFDGYADAYTNNRPSYSKEMIKWLVESYHLSEDSHIIDVGCGTGILSRLFLDLGINVYGVEPNADMRTVAETELANYEKFTLFCGNDKNFNTPSICADMVTCAQAFHWFDIKAFKNECKRVLNNMGRVAIIRMDLDCNSELSEIFRQLCSNFAEDKSAAWKTQIAYSGRIMSRFFRDGIYEYKEFSNDVDYSLSNFIEYMNSISFMPKSFCFGNEKYYSALTDYFDRYSHIDQNDNQILRIPWVVRLFCGCV